MITIKLLSKTSIYVLPSKHQVLFKYLKHVKTVLSYCKYNVIAVMLSHVRRDSLLRNTYVY